MVDESWHLHTKSKAIGNEDFKFDMQLFSLRENWSTFEQVSKLVHSLLSSSFMLICSVIHFLHIYILTGADKKTL